MQTYDHGTFLIVLDCADLNRAADFWCPALGYDRPHPQSGPCLQLVAQARGGVELLLQQVPEPKTEKNRLHLDLRTPDLDAEVARLIELGAAVIRTNRSSSTTGSGTYSPTPTATSSASCNRRQLSLALTTFLADDRRAGRRIVKPTGAAHEPNVQRGLTLPLADDAGGTGH